MMAEDYIAVVKSDSYLTNAEARARCMADIFVTESLAVALAADEWAAVKDMSPELLHGLYPAVFFLGPHVDEFQLFHRELLRFTLNSDGDTFKRFEADMIETYADRHLTDSARVARRLYFDYTHAHAYSLILVMDLQRDPMTDAGNLYKKFWAVKPTKKPRALNVALTVLTMIMLMRDVPRLENIRGCVLPGRWEKMLAAHQAFCARWGFTPIPDLTTAKTAHVVS